MKHLHIHLSVALSIALLGGVTPIQAAGNIVTVTGKVDTGTLDSAIELEDGSFIGFVNDSKIGEMIFSACKDGDSCQITGVVDGKADDKNFLSVFKARKTGKPGAKK